MEGKATEDGKGKGKGMRMGNGRGKGIVKLTSGEVDSSRAVPLQLQKEICEEYSDTGN